MQRRPIGLRCAARDRVGRPLLSYGVERKCPSTGHGCTRRRGPTGVTLWRRWAAFVLGRVLVRTRRAAYPCISDGSGSINVTASSNFGQQPWQYSPPGGYKALNTYNFAAPRVGPGEQQGRSYQGRFGPLPPLQREE